MVFICDKSQPINSYGHLCTIRTGLSLAVEDIPFTQIERCYHRLSTSDAAVALQTLPAALLKHISCLAGNWAGLISSFHTSHGTSLSHLWSLRIRLSTKYFCRSSFERCLDGEHMCYLVFFSLSVYLACSCSL